MDTPFFIYGKKSTKTVFAGGGLSWLGDMADRFCWLH